MRGPVAVGRRHLPSRRRGAGRRGDSSRGAVRHHTASRPGWTCPLPPRRLEKDGNEDVWHALDFITGRNAGMSAWSDMWQISSYLTVSFPHLHVLQKSKGSSQYITNVHRKSLRERGSLLCAWTTPLPPPVRYGLRPMEDPYIGCLNKN